MRKYKIISKRWDLNTETWKPKSQLSILSASIAPCYDTPSNDKIIGDQKFKTVVNIYD